MGTPLPLHPGAPVFSNFHYQISESVNREMKDARIALGNKWMHGWLAGGMDGWELEDGMVIFFQSGPVGGSKIFILLIIPPSVVGLRPKYSAAFLLFPL